MKKALPRHTGQVGFPLRQVHVTFLAHFARWQRLRQDIKLNHNFIKLGNQNVGAEINFFLNQAVSTVYNVSKFYHCNQQEMTGFSVEDSS